MCVVNFQLASSSLYIVYVPIVCQVQKVSGGSGGGGLSLGDTRGGGGKALLAQHSRNLNLHTFSFLFLKQKSVWRH